MNKVKKFWFDTFELVIDSTIQDKEEDFTFDTTLKDHYCSFKIGSRVEFSKISKSFYLRGELIGYQTVHGNFKLSPTAREDRGHKHLLFSQDVTILGKKVDEVTRLKAENFILRCKAEKYRQDISWKDLVLRDLRSLYVFNSSTSFFSPTSEKIERIERAALTKVDSTLDQINNNPTMTLLSEDPFERGLATILLKRGLINNKKC